MPRSSFSKASPAPATLGRSASSRRPSAGQEGVPQSRRAIKVSEVAGHITTALANLDYDRFFKVFHDRTTVYQFFSKWDADKFMSTVMDAFPPIKLNETSHQTVSYSDGRRVVEAKKSLNEQLVSLDSMFREMHEAGFDIGVVRSSLASFRQIISDSYSEMNRETIPPPEDFNELPHGPQIRVDQYQFLSPPCAPMTDEDVAYYENLRKPKKSIRPQSPPSPPRVNNARASSPTHRNGRSHSPARPARRPFYPATPESKRPATTKTASPLPSPNVEKKRSAILNTNMSRSNPPLRSVNNHDAVELQNYINAGPYSPSTLEENAAHAGRHHKIMVGVSPNSPSSFTPNPPAASPSSRRGSQPSRSVSGSESESDSQYSSTATVGYPSHAQIHTHTQYAHQYPHAPQYSPAQAYYAQYVHAPDPGYPQYQYHGQQYYGTTTGTFYPGYGSYGNAALYYFGPPRKFSYYDEDSDDDDEPFVPPPPSAFTSTASPRSSGKHHSHRK